MAGGAAGEDVRLGGALRVVVCYALFAAVCGATFFTWWTVQRSIILLMSHLHVPTYQQSIAYQVPLLGSMLLALVFLLCSEEYLRRGISGGRLAARAGLLLAGLTGINLLAFAGPYAIR